MTKRPRRNHSPTFKAKTPIRSTSQPVAQHPAGGINSVENHLEIGTTLFKKTEPLLSLPANLVRFSDAKIGPCKCTAY